MISLTKGEFNKTYYRPCVYVLYKEDKVLYVGFSGLGLSRVLVVNNHGREKNYRGKAFSEYDRIEVSFYDDAEQASNREVELIKSLQPLYNTDAILQFKRSI